MNIFNVSKTFKVSKKFTVSNIFMVFTLFCSYESITTPVTLSFVLSDFGLNCFV